MALSRRTGRSRFTLLLLVLTSITVLTLDFRGSGLVDGMRNGALTVFGPVRDAASSLFEPIGTAWNGAFNYGDLEKQNEALRQQIEELQGQLAQEGNAAAQLREFLLQADIPFIGDTPTATARVTSGPVSNFEHTIEIDKGSAVGVKVGMPVVTGAGLVGRVEQVTTSRSVVRLVTDPGLDVGVLLETSRDVGVAHGEGDGRPLKVDRGIDPKTIVSRGEHAFTSGVDRSSFPPDIPVGRVVTVSMAGDQLQQIVEIQPLADLDQLAFVRVMLWEPPA